MKNIIKGFKFWILAIVLILAMCMLAEMLSQIITIKTIMTFVYVALGYSFIYLLKN